MGSAIERWKTTVEAHHAQSIRVQKQSSWSEDDFWRPVVSFFDLDPRRSDDPILERLAREVDPSRTVLDVGGGAGKHALPLAMRSKHVTVVDPSESMLEVLRKRTREAGIDNLSIVESQWQEADVETADIVLCSHVLYGTEDLEPFIQKLDSQAKERVLVLLFMQSPPSRFAALWKAVHGEERINLPAVPELMDVLWEMDIYPSLEMFEDTSEQVVENLDVALRLLRHFLFVKPDTEKDERLQAVVSDFALQTPDGFVLRGAQPRREALISWKPG